MDDVTKRANKIVREQLLDKARWYSSEAKRYREMAASEISVSVMTERRSNYIASLLREALEADALACAYRDAIVAWDKSREGTE